MPGSHAQHLHLSLQKEAAFILHTTGAIYRQLLTSDISSSRSSIILNSNEQERTSPSPHATTPAHPHPRPRHTCGIHQQQHHDSYHNPRNVRFARISREMELSWHMLHACAITQSLEQQPLSRTSINQNRSARMSSISSVSILVKSPRPSRVTESHRRVLMGSTVAVRSLLGSASWRLLIDHLSISRFVA